MRVSWPEPVERVAAYLRSAGAEARLEELEAGTATAAVVLLAVLWHFKAGVEERHLAERFPGFSEYARRVPRGI